MALRLTLKRISWAMICGVIFTGTAISICYFMVAKSGQNFLYNNVDDLPYRRVALVLGASPGGDNTFFTYRMDKTAEVYLKHKASYFILSGDNHTRNYNEPKEMRLALLKRGIPDSCLILDFAGFRTLDAVARCKKVFEQDTVLIISQKFHNERALFLSYHFGLHAIAINAKDAPADYTRNILFREWFARVKAVMDCYILNKKPRFYGKPIHIPDTLVLPN